MLIIWIVFLPFILVPIACMISNVHKAKQAGRKKQARQAARKCKARK